MSDIENPEAYNAAIAAKIRKGRERKWLEADASRAALINGLTLAAYDKPGSFLAKMFEAFNDWGSLSQGQEAAVRKIFDKQAERKAAWKAEASKGEFFGEVGKRYNLALVVTFKTSYESAFGTQFVTGFKDENGNQFIHKGANIFADAANGQSLTVKATVKKHNERDGVKQTLISRPIILYWH